MTTSFPATTRSEQGAARVVGPYTTLLDATVWVRRDAVVVGIDSYPGARLNGCVRDATEIAECLSFGQCDYNCVTMFDSEATRSNVLDALGRFAYGNGESGILVFYFAGHGQVLGDQAHLVMFDGKPHDPGVSLAHLGQLMESASSTYRHVIVVLDSCHSGAAFNWTSSRPLQVGDVDRDLRSVNESRCILAACRPEQMAYEQEGRGIFTSTLVSGLLGDAANDRGEVTVLTLYEFVCGSLTGEDQVPVFKGDIAGTVVIGRGFTPREAQKLSGAEVRIVVSKGRGLLDEYQYLHQRELSDTGHRDRVGMARCAAELEPIVRWFETTENGQPVLVSNSQWQSMRDALNQYIAGVSPIRVGQVVRQGVITRRLGRGGFGNVWLAEGDDGHKVAYKVYHSAELHDGIKVERFRSGYGNMRKLEHPRIVRVKDLTAAPLGIVMEYIEGSNLRDSFVDRSDPAICLRFIKEICETVEHAHGRGVKHRDIKPENIIVEYGEDGIPIPYLTDFDLAYHATNRTMTALYGVGGVLNYAAPEQLHTPTAAAARSELVDVFSIAQLMYFVLTAEDPASDSPAQNRSRLSRKLNDWADPRAVTILSELYEKSTHRNPSDRPESVAVFRNQIAGAEAYINETSLDIRWSTHDFLDRVSHAYRGVGNYSFTGPDSVQMLSLSGQVSITLRSKGNSVNRNDHIDLEFELSVTGAIPVASLSSGASARKSLNQRLDRVVRRHDHVERHHGSHGSFQTFIVMRFVPMSTAGITKAVNVLGDCVGCVDGA
ncbi:protein kinase domain-containing protein [Nocardia puris]|uniref:protein kinase domain-containing protein n=1 Tax=Nocardia puris TaxID=208602 RepID=UPI002D766684|nr:protein kinase [Nocardia puris]